MILFHDTMINAPNSLTGKLWDVQSEYVQESSEAVEMIVNNDQKHYLLSYKQNYNFVIYF